MGEFQEIAISLLLFRYQMGNVFRSTEFSETMLSSDWINILYSKSNKLLTVLLINLQIQEIEISLNIVFSK